MCLNAKKKHQHQQQHTHIPALLIAFNSIWMAYNKSCKCINFENGYTRSHDNQTIAVNKNGCLSQLHF